MTIWKQFGKAQNAGARFRRESSRKAVKLGVLQEISASVRQTLLEGCALPRKQARTGLRWEIG